jgi:hypothetical protein
MTISQPEFIYRLCCRTYITTEQVRTEQQKVRKHSVPDTHRNQHEHIPQ